MTNEAQKPWPVKPRVLLWTDLSCNDMEEIAKAESIVDMERVLCRALNIDIPQPKLGVLLQLYTNTMRFCRKQQFTKEQTGVLILITRNMHQLNTASPSNNISQCLSYCSELLLCHSINRPPFSISLFSLDQVTQITKHIINQYMRHYALYKFIFTPQVLKDLSLLYIGMPEETPPEELESSEAEKEIEKEVEYEPSEEGEGEEAFTETTAQATEAPKEEPPPQERLRSIVRREVKDEVMRLTAEKTSQDHTDTGCYKEVTPRSLKKTYL